jgi:DNA-binding transcriptional regulator YiaG
MDNKNMNEFFGSLHETAVGLHKIGVISDAEMREYDRNCLDREREAISWAETIQNKPVTPAFAGSRTQVGLNSLA